MHTNIDKRLRNIYKKFSSNLESNENGSIRDRIHNFIWGARYLMGENLKVVWAEFSM
jgi:hypothetical protein